MYSSGIKRGLAVSAVSALAISGIAASASADTVNQQVGPQTTVVLLSQDDGLASVKNDGTDSTVRLEAAASADVTSVTFGYQVGGSSAPIQSIATVGRNDDGAFSHEWNVPAALIGADITLVATGNVAGDLDVDDRAVTIDDDAAPDSASTVNLTTDSQQGVFQQPYADEDAESKLVIVAGTASDDSGPITIEAPLDSTIAPITTNATEDGEFVDVLDITGYTFNPFSTPNSNQLPLRAVNDTDDVESYTLYNQAIGTVTAVADDEDTPAGAPTDVTVTVTDTQGAPIAGAQVFSSAGGPAAYTDTDGVVTVQQTAGTTAFYYANATDSNPFSAAEGDKRSVDIVAGNAGQAAAIEGGSDTGFEAFDVDEEGADTATLVVRDANGRRVAAGTPVDYRVEYTPFDADSADDTTETTGSGVTDEDGEVVVPIDDASGDYEVYASIPADSGTGTGDVPERLVASFTAGQSSLGLDPDDDQTATAGGTVAFTGTLALEDGTPLADRDVTVDYTRGGNGSDATPDSGLADGDDAGTGADLTADLTTDADGEVAFTVVDPSNDGSELDNEVVASFDDGSIVGVLSDPVEVDFATATPPTGTTVVIGPDNDTYRPGDPVDGSATVTSPDGADAGTDRDPVEGQLVTLTTDTGYFTSGDPAGGPDAEAGTYENLGTSITVTSEDDGTVEYQLVVGRDQGFDDDGAVEGTVTARAGSASDTEDYDFSTDYSDGGAPLNGGDVTLEVSDADEQDGPVDPAEVGQYVALDVYTTDGFGNRIGGIDVDLDYDPDDDVDGNGSAESDFTDDGDAEFASFEEQSVEVTATWDAPVTLNSDLLGGSSATATEELTDSVTVDFEEFVLTSAAITSNPEGQVQPGTAVTETLTALDNNGNPVGGAQVTFQVTAPDGSVQTLTRTTNAQGQATIVVVAAQEGSYRVDAVVNDETDTVSASDTIVVDDGVGETTPASASIVSTPEGEVDAGTSVVETLTVLDENGNPFQGAQVTFRITSPDGTAQEFSRTTDAQGRATITIVAAQEGTYTVSAQATDGTATVTASDTIVVTMEEPPVDPTGTLAGRSNGPRADRLVVRTTDVEAGTNVRLFRFNANGGQRLVDAGTVNGNGVIRFTVADRNGKGITKYVARVGAGDGAFFTNSKRVR